MLEKLIIHLKNIIFFRLVMFFLSVAILILLIKNLNENYAKSVLENQNAQEFLAAETLKLYSITNAIPHKLENYILSDFQELATQNFSTFTPYIPIYTEMLDPQFTFQFLKSQEYTKNMEDTKRGSENRVLTNNSNQEHKILTMCKKYTKLLDSSSQQKCFERMKLLKLINNLSDKYHLVEPINTTITQVFFKDINQNGQIHNSKIKNYDVKLQFATPDFTSFLMLTKEIYSCMPDNTIVVSVRIRRQDVLEPKVIYKLSTEKSPDLIYTKLNMRIREITTSR